jgi:2-oxo-3-hexenedioate decarboxylase
MTSSVSLTIDSTSARAAMILAAADQCRPIPPLTVRDPTFGLDDAYEVAGEVRRLREARGERVVGRKIGFTNTTMWDEYNVAAPIWGYVYDSTRHGLSEVVAPVELAPFVEPRIEPEIVFGLAQAPERGMDERALVNCVDWVALGFEVVQSVFPGWRFRAPDTVAAFGLHGALYIGEAVTLTPESRGDWQERLRRFGIPLRQGDGLIEEGRASNVLSGGPLSALRHLVEVLAETPGSPSLAAGEVITTGTLTNAYPVTAGETWSTLSEGLPLKGIKMTFG